MLHTLKFNKLSKPVNKCCITMKKLQMGFSIGNFFLVNYKFITTTSVVFLSPPGACLFSFLLDMPNGVSDTVFAISVACPVVHLGHMFYRNTHPNCHVYAS